jgi:hypothetical protein
MALGGLEDAYVKYWDEGSMIAVLEFEVEQSTKSGQEQTNKEKKEKKKKGWPSVVRFFSLALTMITAITQDAPKKATILPLSDKPVTLSFNKGGLSINKPTLTGKRFVRVVSHGFADQPLASSASKVAPVSLGFSLAEEGDGQDDSDANAGDSKGLSHASRCARYSSGCVN